MSFGYRYGEQSSTPVDPRLARRDRDEILQTFGCSDDDGDDSTASGEDNGDNSRPVSEAVLRSSFNGEEVLRLN